MLPGCFRACSRDDSGPSVLSRADFLFAFAAGASAGTAVFFHATRNGIRHPTAWASFVFLLLVIGLPWYVLYVRRLRRRQ